MKIRKARAGDIPAIHRIIEHYAALGVLLPRDPDDIRKHLRGFIVAADGRQMIGCVSLEFYNVGLAEIRSLAVNPEIRGQGLGTQLLKAALDLATELKLSRVFALTSSPRFFLAQGFGLARRQAMHEKVDRDCIHCSKANTCRLSAVVMDLSGAHPALNIVSVGSEAAQAE